MSECQQRRSAHQALQTLQEQHATEQEQHQAVRRQLQVRRSSGFQKLSCIFSSIYSYTSQDFQSLRNNLLSCV